MATDLERLVVQLSADIKGYENALKRAQGVTTSQTRRIQKQFDTMNRGLTAGFSKLGVAIGAAFAAGRSLQGAQRLIDSATRIENALKVAGLAGEDLEKVYQRLFVSAQKNAAPLETLVTLYSRATLVQKELGASSEELLAFTDRVALALRVSGQSAEQAQGALLQLGQALSTGVVRAEEYNSLQEGAVPILRAVAAGLKEAGGSVGTLTNLVKTGQVTSEAFFRAFEAGAPLLEQKVAGAALTLDQRFTQLSNALVDAAKRFNESSQAAETFGAAIDNVADFVNSIDFDGLISQIRAAASAFDSGASSAAAFAQSIGSITGLDNLGSFLTGGAVKKEFLGGALTVTSSKALQERIDKAFENQIQKAGALTEEAIRNSVLGQGGGVTPKTDRLPETTIKPVSLSDFAPPSSKGSGKGGSKSKADEYQREVQQIRERTAAIQAETAAMAGLNPLVNDYGFALEKARAEQELLQAAQAAGKAITPELRAEIDQLATAYANAEVAAERLAEQQDAVKEAAGFFADTIGQAFMDLVPAIETGNKALDNLLNTLIEAVIQATLLGKGPLGGLLGGGGGAGGLLGAIFGSIFHKGGVVGQDAPKRAVSPAVFAGAQRYHSGGVAGLRPGEVPAILQKGEVVIPRGSRATNDNRATTINMPVTISAPGADPAQLARVERAVHDLNRSLPKQIDARMHVKQTRGVRA